MFLRPIKPITSWSNIDFKLQKERDDLYKIFASTINISPDKWIFFARIFLRAFSPDAGWRGCRRGLRGRSVSRFPRLDPGPRRSQYPSYIYALDNLSSRGRAWCPHSRRSCNNLFLLVRIFFSCRIIKWSSWLAESFQGTCRFACHYLHLLCGFKIGSESSKHSCALAHN